MEPLHESVAERFWVNVGVTNDPEDCWEWMGEIIGSRDSSRGEFWMGGKKHSSSRAAWILAVGPIPDGLWVLHTCDNGRCCNPAHLYLGTAKDNVRDMMERGRARMGLHMRNNPRCGEQSSRAILTEVVVQELRAARLTGKSYEQLGREFGISKATVCQVVTGTTWIETGGVVTPKKPRSKMTPEAVREFRELFATGRWSLAELSEMKGVTSATASRIVRATVWKEVGGPLKEYRGRRPGDKSKPPPPMFGEANPKAKMTWEKVRSLRHQAAAGARRDELAVAFGLSKAGVEQIINGRTWKE